MRISTRSPWLATSDANREAQEGPGAPLVPRRASVNMDTFKSGLFLRASSMANIKSFSELPMYKVDKYIRFRALRIFDYQRVRNSADRIHQSPGRTLSVS